MSTVVQEPTIASPSKLLTAKMAPSRDQLMKTALAVVDAHNSLDVDTMGAICSPSFRQRTAPRPVKAPDRNKQEYLEFLKTVLPTFHSFRMRLTEGLSPVIDEVARKVVLYVNANAEADAGSYANEYILTLTMNEDGTLLEDEVDWIDSATMLGWLDKLGQFAQDTWGKK